MSLERRYRRLLRAYPATYRAERGEEIIGTYLALARPGRRWPSPADAADVLAGGFREQLRAHRAEGLLAVLGLAAPHHPPRLARLAPLLAVAVVTGQALVTAHSVRLPWDPSALPWILQPWAELLLAGTLLGGLAWAAWRDGRGLWAALVLSPALALVWVLPREYLAGGHQPAAVLLDSAVVLVAGLALVLAAVRINGLAARLRAARPGGISRAPTPRPEV